MLDISINVNPVINSRRLAKIKSSIYYNPRELKKTTSSKSSLYHIGLNFNREAGDILDLRLNNVLNQFLGSGGKTTRNKRTGNSVPLRINGTEGKVNYTNVQVTNIIDSFGNPLFYGHRLNKEIDLGSLQVLKDGKEVDLRFLKLINESNPFSEEQETTNIVLCHNLENLNTVYKVRYKLNGIIKEEIINSEDLFKRDRFSQVPYNYSLDLESRICVYFIREEQEEYVVSLPEDSSSFFLREKRGGGFICDFNKATLSNEIWYPVISNYEWKNENIKYKISEWYEEIYDLGSSYKYIKKDYGFILSDSLLQVSYKNIVDKIEEQTKYIEIVLFDDTYSIGKIITNNPQKENVYSSKYNKVWTINKKISVDSLTGLIYVGEEQLQEYEKVHVSYPYRNEHQYTISDLNLNPFIDTSLIGKRIIYYLVPWTKDIKKNIFYIVIDENGDVESLNQTGANGEDDKSNWIGLVYEYPEDQSLYIENGLGITVTVGEESVKTQIESNGYLLLGEFVIPNNLKEVKDSIITKSLEVTHKEWQELKAENIKSLSKLDNYFNENIFTLPILKNIQVLEIPWMKCKDYVEEELFTKEEIIDLGYKNYPANKKIRLSFSFVPVISIKTDNIDWIGETFKITWSPLFSWKNKEISGKIYTSIDGITYSEDSTIISMSAETYKEINMPVGKRIFVKIVPIWNNNSGPTSNILLCDFN